MITLNPDSSMALFLTTGGRADEEGTVGMWAKSKLKVAKYSATSVQTARQRDVDPHAPVQGKDRYQAGPGADVQHQPVLAG